MASFWCGHVVRSHRYFVHKIQKYQTVLLLSSQSARPAPAASFYNPIHACTMQYAFDAFINLEFGSRLNVASRAAAGTRVIFYYRVHGSFTTTKD